MASRAALQPLAASFWRLPAAAAPCLLSPVSSEGCSAEGTCAPSSCLDHCLLALPLFPRNTQHERPTAHCAPLQAAPRQLLCWADYYAWRGLPAESPAALLLDSVLTLCAALQRLGAVEAAAAAAGGLPTEGPVVVHYLGEWCLQLSQKAEHSCVFQTRAANTAHAADCATAGPQREVAHWPAFIELGSLLPDHHLRLLFLGPDVPAAAAGRSLTVPSPTHGGNCGAPGCSCAALSAVGGYQPQEQAGQRQPGSLRLSWHRGLYHEVAPALQGIDARPHLVVGPNAGQSGGHLSMLPLLQQLRKLCSASSPPVLFAIPCKKPVLTEAATPGQVALAAAVPPAAAAGLAAYPSWIQTLELLMAGMRSAPSAPAACLFTDYNEEALHRARELACAVLSGALSGGPLLCAEAQEGENLAARAPAPARAIALGEVAMNPFRKLLLLRPTDNALPTCSNAFELWLHADGQARHCSSF